MKLKLDLHPIFNDSRKIETALEEILAEAIARRATEVEIIPGKGSGALKKSVIRFLDRPEIKAQYHRIERDSDNWGKLYVHFKHPILDPGKPGASVKRTVSLSAKCACCADEMNISLPGDDLEPGTLNETSITILCPWCGSPNRIVVHTDRRGRPTCSTMLDYSDAG